jgi:hypothetical protein
VTEPGLQVGSPPYGGHMRISRRRDAVLRLRSKGPVSREKLSARQLTCAVARAAAIMSHDLRGRGG